MAFWSGIQCSVIKDHVRIFNQGTEIFRPVINDFISSKVSDLGCVSPRQGNPVHRPFYNRLTRFGARMVAGGYQA
jgi:hypothetical protein